MTESPSVSCACGGDVRRIVQPFYQGGRAKDPRLDSDSVVDGNLRHLQALEEGIASGEFGGYYEHGGAAEEYRPDASRVASLAAAGAHRAGQAADEALAASKSGNKSERENADRRAAVAADNAKAAKTRAKALAQSVPTAKSVGPVVQA